MEYSKWLLGGIFVLAGLLHFIKPKFYLRIMPPYIPWHKQMVFLSGLAEVTAGALLLYPATSSLGAILIVLLLVLFFPVHIHMLSSKKAGMGVNKFVLVLRLFGQFALIYWVSLFL